MTFDDLDSVNDASFAEKYERRNGPVKRPKATRRRTGKPVVGSSSPGGIRQRRNKRWSW